MTVRARLGRVGCSVMSPARHAHEGHVDDDEQRDDQEDRDADRRAVPDVAVADDRALGVDRHRLRVGPRAEEDVEDVEHAQRVERAEDQRDEDRRRAAAAA